MNPYLRLIELLPSSPLQIGTVTAHNSDGTSTVLLISGGTQAVRGQTVAVSAKAFFRNGLIEGEAPNLSGVVIEV